MDRNNLTFQICHEITTNFAAESERSGKSGMGLGQPSPEEQQQSERVRDGGFPCFGGEGGI
jgi:hypothetical protein